MKNNNSFGYQVLNPLLLVIKHFSARNAFCIDHTFYTYNQLGQNISKIRSAIQKNIPRDEIHIGLVANDDIETYASIFALWLEGKAYIPFHPGHPLQRSEEIINQINIKTILDSGKTSVFFDQLVLNTNHLTFTDDFLTNDVVTDNDGLAYILFTSGSTGIPKGVTISRQNLGAFMDSFWDCDIAITDQDRCLQCFDLTFDVSIQCFLAPLIKGACAYTIPHNQIKYSYVFGLLEDQRLTFAAMAPSMVRYLKPYFEEIYLPELKYCILTGEASPVNLVHQWQKCIPNAEVFNFYGPTEATIYCCRYKIHKGGEIQGLNGMLSIGTPMKNVKAIVIDEHHNIVPAGEKGELVVLGDQVSPGYWHNPEKNAAAFFEKEYEGRPERFYHTGDLCSYDDNGNLLLYGRLDFQVKIQGYRVELGEIEYHARDYMEGNDAVALTFTNYTGQTEIALFIEGNKINTELLSNYMRTKMPFYMIPAKIILAHEFPLNANGKVDKKKLKQLMDERALS